MQDNVEDEFSNVENKVGDLSDLQTVDKSSIVNAINESIYSIKKYSNADVLGWLKNSWSANGVSEAFVDSNGIKTLSISIRNGTNANCMTLPLDMRPSSSRIFSAYSLTGTGYITISSAGEVTVYGSIYSPGDGSLLFNITYS